MPKISYMPSPAMPLTGLELLPVLQGGGADGNVGIPAFAYGNVPRGAVQLLRVGMLADMSATTDSDPGAGNVRWNNADPGAATEVYISETDADAGSIATQLTAASVGGFLYLQGSADSDARDDWQRWQITGVTDNTGYVTLAVTLQASGGAFVDDDPLELSLQQPTPSPGVDRNVLTVAASSSGTLSLDASLGDYFKSTLTEDVTTLAIASVPAVCTLALQLVQDSTDRAVTWPASFNWGDGVTPPSMPSGAAAVLFVMLTTFDAGATWDATARARA